MSPAGPASRAGDTPEASGDSSSGTLGKNIMQIYIAKNGQKTGPFTTEQIHGMIASSMLNLNDSAWAEGHADWKPLHQLLGICPPAPPVVDASGNPQSMMQKTKGPRPIYLYIPTGRLIFLSIISCGLFNCYWVYKNWRFIKERDNLKIRPFWRGFWCLFHFHSLLKYIKEDEKIHQLEKPSYSCGWLTAGFVIFNISGSQLIFPSMLAFLFILPAHNYISKINQAEDITPDYVPWSGGQIFCAVFLPAIFLVAFFVAFFAELANQS